jgi:hypothetical protein
MPFEAPFHGDRLGETSLMREALNSQEENELLIHRRPGLQPLSCQQNSSYLAPETRRLSPPQSHSQSPWGASGKEVPKVNRSLAIENWM